MRDLSDRFGQEAMRSNLPVLVVLVVLTHSRICTFSQLFQLLEGTRMALIHGWYSLAAA